jgi:hypothetical protein
VHTSPAADAAHAPAPAHAPARSAGARFALLSLAALALCVAVASAVSTAAFVHRAHRVFGWVDDVSPRPLTRDQWATIRYAGPGGRRGVMSVPVRHGRLEVGDEVELLYDPARPADVRRSSLFVLWRTTLLAAVAAIGFFAAGIARPRE